MVPFLGHPVDNANRGVYVTVTKPYQVKSAWGLISRKATFLLVQTVLHSLKFYKLQRIRVRRKMGPQSTRLSDGSTSIMTGRRLVFIVCGVILKKQGARCNTHRILAGDVSLTYSTCLVMLSPQR